MMRILLSSLLAMATVYMCTAQDQGIIDQYTAAYHTTSDGFTLPYRHISPSVVEKGEKYPLVIVLHGGGERGDDNKKQLSHGADLFAATTTREAYPAYVIFPQCRQESYWASADIDRSSYPVSINFDYKNKDITPDLEAVMDLAKDMMKRLPIDKKRVYIAGLSMGGMGTFEMVHRYPKCFAAAIPICGGGDGAAYSKKAHKVPFWVFHGSDDGVVKVDESLSMVAALKGNGFNIKYTEYPGVNHDSWNNAFAEPDFLSWMFSQRR